MTTIQQADDNAAVELAVLRAISQADDARISGYNAVSQAVQRTNKNITHHQAVNATAHLLTKKLVERDPLNEEYFRLSIKGCEYLSTAPKVDHVATYARADRGRGQAWGHGQ